jgi:hypothetical protein
VWIDVSALLAMPALTATPRVKMMAEMIGNAQILRLILMLPAPEVKTRRTRGGVPINDQEPE